jgi:hypothetical protein
VATDYGSDIFLGATGLSMQFPRISGPAVVAYNLFRRCTTSETLPAYRGNSFDVSDRVKGAKISLTSLPSIEKDIIRVAVFEERISAVYPKVTLVGDKLKISIKGVLVTGEDFSLTIDMVKAEVVNVAV